MMIPINDMFRLQRVIKWPKVRFWFIEEWTPGPTLDGQWKPYTKLMRDDEMDQLLERMQCPVEAHAAFRAEALPDRGSSPGLEQAGAQKRVFSLETGRST